VQDKSVAFKIFELGLKKWSSSVDFVLAYLDYLSHLNEDNNTRLVLLTGMATQSVGSKIFCILHSGTIFVPFIFSQIIEIPYLEKRSL
jgi:hypothetical protein